MSLSIGTRLGPYEILGPLGRGGMGEVYRARDSRLDREVAIKVLPELHARAPEYRARFEREARSLATLSHPNICTLHDVGRSHDDGTDYLVMELVQGETLASRIRKGPLPIPELLARASEIAAALHAAHRAGVLHRDLKPANIMLTRTGAKLMDFGLGRITTYEPTRSGQTQASTEAIPITGEGTILGTVPYMAPEQLEGSLADSRSDIWALGVTLYEMATGTRPFQGASSASLIGSILRDEPRTLLEHIELAPAELDRLVRRCLVKDPEERLQSAGDLAQELRWLSSAQRAVPELAPGATRGTPEVVLSSRADRRPWLIPVLLAGALTLGAFYAGRTILRSSGAVVRSTVIAPVRSLQPLRRDQFSISPDGRMILFVLADSAGRSQMYLRPLASDAAQPVGEPGAHSPIWSPDSREIAFLTSEDRLVKMPAAGGALQTLCKAPGLESGTWSTDHWIIFGLDSGPLMRVRDSGGEPIPATVLDTTRHETLHQYPEMLEDGRHFTYATDPALGPARFRIMVGSTRGGPGRELMVAHHAPVSDGAGHLVFMRDRTLLAQRVARDGSRLIGQPTPLSEAPDRSGSGADPIVKVGGDVMLYRPLNNRPVRIGWYSREGIPLEEIAGEPHVIAPLISPDGRRAVMRGVQGGETWLVSVDLGSGEVERLTPMEAWNSWPIWSASGHEIYHATGLFGDSTGIEAMTVEAPRKSRPILRRPYYIRPECDAGPQGLVILQSVPGRSSDLLLLDPQTDGGLRSIASTDANEVGGELTAGGSAIVYASDLTGRPELYMARLDAPYQASRLTHDGISVDAGLLRQPCFVVGDEVFYVSLDGQVLRSFRLAHVGEGWQAVNDQTLFRLPPGLRGLCPAPDGRRFLLLTIDVEDGLPAVSVVQGWRQEISKR